MDKHKKLIVGYDLCEEYTQINCYSYKAMEPLPIYEKEDNGKEHNGKEHNGKENNRKENNGKQQIPTALFYHEHSKQWLFGEEAVRAASNPDEKEKGSFIDGLLQRLKSKDTIEIDHISYNGVTLLEKYMRKTLSLLKRYFPVEPITKIVITVDDSDPEIVNGIYEALSLLGIEKDRAHIISHGHAYLYYVLNQETNLWFNDVGLFDFHKNGLNYYQMSVNRRTQPMIASLVKNDLSEYINVEHQSNKVPSDLCYTFENIANTVLHKQIISTLFFTGKGFEGEWVTDTIKKFCIGRRVFLGQNLYVAGACYAAKEFAGDKKINGIILLHDEMLTASLSIRVYQNGKIDEVPLTDAAILWYELNHSLELLVDETNEIEVMIKSLLRKEIHYETLDLSFLPNRPKRMTRIHFVIQGYSKNEILLRIEDLGFGTYYPKSDCVFEKILKIE